MIICSLVFEERVFYTEVNIFIYYVKGNEQILGSFWYVPKHSAMSEALLSKNTNNACMVIIIVDQEWAKIVIVQFLCMTISFKINEIF